MARKVAIVIATFFLVASAWAGDPWKEKSYKEWDEKDLRKILSDSPWVKEVRVGAPWQERQREAGIGQKPAAPGAESRTAYPAEAAGATEQPSVQAPAEPSQTPQATFLVRWHSARTIRQAVVRANVLRGAMQERDGENLLAQEPSDYQIVVLGPDMVPFAQSDENSLKEKAYLRLKKSKQKLAPSRVQIQRGEANKAVAVIFYFPKKTETGEAVIALDEKGAEFFCQAPGASLKASFDLQKMAAKQGIDL